MTKIRPKKDAPLALFVAPHCDDICFSSFLAVKHEAKNCQTFILTVFNRSCWTFLSTPAPKKRAVVTRLRRKEEMNFARQVKAKVAFMELKDSSLRYSVMGSEYRKLPSRDPVYKIVRKGIQAFLRRHPLCYRIYVPVGISNHVDHLICRDVVLELARDRCIPVILYEDLPYIGRLGKRQIKIYFNSLNMRLNPRCIPAKSARSKIAALQLYPSQLEMKTIPDIMGYGLKLGKSISRGFAERYWWVK